MPRSPEHNARITEAATVLAGIKLYHVDSTTIRTRLAEAISATWFAEAIMMRRFADADADAAAAGDRRPMLSTPMLWAKLHQAAERGDVIDVGSYAALIFDNSSERDLT